MVTAFCEIEFLPSIAMRELYDEALGMQRMAERAPPHAIASSLSDYGRPGARGFRLIPRSLGRTPGVARAEHQSENFTSCTKELLSNRVRAITPNQREDGGIAGLDHVAHVGHEIVGDSVFFLPGTRVAGTGRSAGSSARHRPNPPASSSLPRRSTLP